jgi:phosphate transport system permease protein
MDRWFYVLCMVTASVSVAALVVLIGAILIKGIPSLSLDLLLNPPSDVASEAGIWPALWGTIWVCGLCALITLPTGVATAILLEEFPPRKPIGRILHNIVQLNISNLAGVPSVVYGILGLTAFVTMFGLVSSARGTSQVFEIGATYYDQFLTESERTIYVRVDSPDAPPTQLTPGMTALDSDYRPVQVNVIEPSDPYPEDEQVLQYTVFSDSEGGRIPEPTWYNFRIPFGRGVLAGALTLMLVILPIVIISAQEAIRAVPDSLRSGALGLGATRWQVIWNVTLPASIPGIMTGSILALSRAIGEAAPLLIISGVVFIRYAPRNLMDDFTVMPLQIYNWAGRPQQPFQDLAAASIILLLLILLSFNAVAVLIRQKLQKPLS